MLMVQSNSITHTHKKKILLVGERIVRQVLVAQFYDWTDFEAITQTLRLKWFSWQS